jgi:Beta-glucosidase-related glycosidases
MYVYISAQSKQLDTFNLMKKYFAIIAIVISSACNQSSQSITGTKVKDRETEEKIEKILSKMTLQEKVGQMTQLTLDVIGKGESIYESNMPFEIDDSLLDTVISHYKVGSIINTATNTPLSVKEWNNAISKIQKRAFETTGIPVLYGVDEIHGVTYTIDGILFPQGIGMGATFSTELVRQEAVICAYETRACSIPWNFSPVLDLGRDPRWARMWESYSEDPYMVSEMGKACVEGYQGDDPLHISDKNVAACLKHYMGYGVTMSGKDRTPSNISEQDMREKHFASYLETIRKGALSVMVNSGLNNGLPYHINYTYLTKWLKEDLNWDGVIVTDWADINNLFTRDKVAASQKEAIKLAINAGIDISMVPYELSFCNDLIDLVKNGEVAIDRIDDAVRRILRLKFRLNLFDHPISNIEDYPDFGSEKHAEAARRSAEESITLLKNDGILPLKSGCRVLVSGPNANSMRTLNGGWTLSWQGEKADIYGEKYSTILEAVRGRAGKENVVYEPGVTYKTSDPPTTSIQFWEENEPEISKAVNAARNVDYIILCLGENSYCETPGNLETLDLSDNQTALAESLAATGKPVILVLNEGRPRVIRRIVPKMKAILQTYLPGNYGGEALASILWGDVNPSGRLPYTYPKAANSLLTYDYKPSESVDKMAGAYDYDAVASVQWPFGFGLSYTKFEYSGFTVNKDCFSANDSLYFSVNVKNVGERDGKEAVMLFSSDLYASLSPDNRRLRAFKKIDLQAGETKKVDFAIPASRLAFVGADGKWRIESGEFMIQAGTEVLNINCTETKIWDTPNITTY